MNEYKKKKSIDHGVQCLHFQKKKKKKDIKLRGIQVVLYIDQRGHVKQISSDFSSNWLDVFFNLTKGMTGSLLSDQFQNIELDSKLYSLENQYLCFYVSSYLHWWLCIRFLKLRLQLTLTFDLETSFRLMYTIWSNLLNLLLIELMLKVYGLNYLLILVYR